MRYCAVSSSIASTPDFTVIEVQKEKKKVSYVLFTRADCEVREELTNGRSQNFKYGPRVQEEVTLHMRNESISLNIGCKCISLESYPSISLSQMNQFIELCVKPDFCNITLL